MWTHDRLRLSSACRYKALMPHVANTP